MSWPSDMDTHYETFRDEWHDLELFQWKAVADRWQEYDDRLRKLFGDFKSGDVDEVQPIIAKLNDSASSMVRDSNEHIGGVRDRIRDWEGEAADNFRDYLNQMQDALEWKKGCVEAARHSMRAYARLQQEFRSSVLDLIADTQDALEEAEQEDEAAEREKMVNIIGTVFAVGAAIPSGGTSALIGATGALTAGGANSAVIKPGGGKKNEIIMKLVDEGEKVVGEAIEAADRVKNALFEVTANVTNVRDKNLRDARPERPDIVTDDKFDPNDFRHEDQPDGTTDRVRRDDLVEEPKEKPDRKRDREISDPDNPLPGNGPIPLAPDAYPEQ